MDPARPQWRPLRAEKCDGQAAWAGVV